MQHPDFMARVLNLVYENHTREDWVNVLTKLEVKVRSDNALPALSVALPRFARHGELLPHKDKKEWQKAVEEAYGEILELDIGVRMSGVVIDFMQTGNRHEFLKLPLEERVLAESLFE